MMEAEPWAPEGDGCRDGGGTPSPVVSADGDYARNMSGRYASPPETRDHSLGRPRWEPPAAAA